MAKPETIHAHRGTSSVKKKYSAMNIHKLCFVRGLHLSVFPVSLFLGYEDVESPNEAVTLCFLAHVTAHP